MTEVIKTTTEIFNKQGFNSASQYIILISVIVIGAGMLWYFKKTINDTDKEREENNALQKKVLEMLEASSNRQYEAVIEINKSIIQEVKNISESIKEGIQSIKETSIKSNEMIEALLEKNNEKIITTIGKEKTLSTKEFEIQAKGFFEIGLLRTNNSINERIEKNNLVKLKTRLRGSESCCYLDGELASIAKDHMNDSKNNIKALEFENTILRDKIIFEYDKIITQMNIELSTIFDVEDGYSKVDLFGETRALIKRTLNLSNAMEFEKM